MTKKEADAYSEWFLSKIDERSEYLREIVSEGLHIDIKQLDFIKYVRDCLVNHSRLLTIW